MIKRVDLTGERFGRWVVRELGDKNKHGQSLWVCVCDCGNINEVQTSSLTQGKSKSCGCLNLEINTKHNHTKRGWVSRTYKSWESMKRRCYSETDVAHESYRSRGIKVCDRWLHSFENFLADMGERPEGKTLDRIENKGGYIPENCRWATRSEQQRNKENTKLYDYKGKTGPLIYWVESLGISKSTLLHRLNDLHWGIEKSFSTPVRKSKNSS